jgi:hypothetical protein
MSRKAQLVGIYRRYGFTLARTAANDAAIVFTLKNGYFDNAEIVKLDPQFDIKDLFEEFSRSGYACTVREATTPSAAEQQLFNGFFSVESTKERLQDDYRRFANSLVKLYGDKATYQYIKAPYQIDGRPGELDVPQEVLNRMDVESPVLFLIEAAAGFGKTCTAQEISRLLASSAKRLPLYAELSRNRQARIFRYILLDEIDRTFPLLSSRLVQGEIGNGRVSVILDGFDELLRKGEEGEDFDKKEPMLETVSELLTGSAKIIITTRRTVLFDGDEFHQWLERHTNDFSVVRIRIQEPRTSDWLNHDRLEALEQSGLDLNAMANPVLLSYLRCIDDEAFKSASEDPDQIVQSYFEYMLDRERDRQDLRMTVGMQSDVLRSISEDMIRKGYTAEERDYIVKVILENCSAEIEVARSQYSASDKPTREEIANKLASHALLDRSGAESTKIGFVNEFALGNYVAENIVGDDEWLCDDLRFIEPAVKAYAPRTETARAALFAGLQPTVPFLDKRAHIEITTELVGKLPDNLSDGSVDDLELEHITVGESVIRSFQFSNTTFKDCVFNIENLDNVTFLNCRFFGCLVEGGSFGGAVYILGCESEPDIAPSLDNSSDRIAEPLPVDVELMAENSVLRRFWPAGDHLTQKPTRPVFKPLRHLCQPSEGLSSAEQFDAVDRLLKAGVLIQMGRSNLIGLNLENVEKAYHIFRRYQ